MRKSISLVLTITLVSQILFVPLSVLAQSPPPSGATYTYDKTGNLTSDGQRTITWNASGMPVKIELTGKGIEASFIYDGSGARIAKIVKTNGQLTSTTVYFGNMEKETDYTQSPAKQTITKYYFAGGKRIALRKNNGDPIYLHKDHLSSSTLFTNNAGEKQDVLLTYYPYGTTRPNWDLPTEVSLSGTKTGLSSALSFLPSNHLYTDQIQDPETELYYYNARYYNPTIGMFISADTAADSLNKYAYANNNPILFNDPSGHAAITDWGGSDVTNPPPPPPENPGALYLPMVLQPIHSSFPIEYPTFYDYSDTLDDLGNAGYWVTEQFVLGTAYLFFGPPEIPTTSEERVKQNVEWAANWAISIVVGKFVVSPILKAVGKAFGPFFRSVSAFLRDEAGTIIDPTDIVGARLPAKPYSPGPNDIDLRGIPGITQQELTEMAIKMSGRPSGDFVAAELSPDGIPQELVAPGNPKGVGRVRIGFDPAHPLGFGPDCPHCNLEMGISGKGTRNIHILVGEGVIKAFRTQPGWLQNLSIAMQFLLGAKPGP
jgi:RHS repeat-associated protein